MSLKGNETRLGVARVALFDQPKRIIFATGAVEQFVGSETKRLGGNKTLLVTDKGVKKAGMADTVLDLIKKENLSVDVYDNLTAEPTAESLRAAVKFAREGKYDAVVGVGGGAVHGHCEDECYLSYKPGRSNGIRESYGGQEQVSG